MSAELTSRSGGALLLAAGFSRRFGSDKRRQQLPDGRTLLEATVMRYSEVFRDICVVLRTEDEVLARTVRGLPGNPEIAIAEDAELGMGHSLAAGMRTVVSQSSEPWQWAAIASQFSGSL